MNGGLRTPHISLTYGFDYKKLPPFGLMNVQVKRCEHYRAQRDSVSSKEVSGVGFLRSRRSQSGQGMVEYALILVLVSIVVIVILLTMGNQIANVFSNVVAALGA